MGHIHEDILIEAPVEVVYALFRDPTCYPGIVVDGIVDVEHQRAT